VEQLRYISGDTWNVNPPALKRIERLYCRNERAPITTRLDRDGARVVLVPVAAVLVASIRLPWYDAQESVRAKGPRAEPLSHRFAKGEEMGWFEHGSTIVVIAPPQWRPDAGLSQGRMIRLGEALLRREA
jgi:phosphatidylserine decarboxylase